MGGYQSRPDNALADSYTGNHGVEPYGPAIGPVSPRKDSHPTTNRITVCYTYSTLNAQERSVKMPE